MFSYDEIKELVKLISENDLGSIEIKSANGDSITIKGREKEVIAPQVQTSLPKASAATLEMTENTAEMEAESTENTQEKKYFKSPMVGTFYSAADPDSKPFVEEGTEVKKGDVICIIEAMKIMNEVNADFDGTIKEVLVTNGEAVEYDQPLFEIK